MAFGKTAKDFLNDKTTTQAIKKAFYLPAQPVELSTQPAALVTTKPATSFWLLVAAGLILLNQ